MNPFDTTSSAHFEIEVCRPGGWVELGTDQGGSPREFHDREEIRDELERLAEDHFRTRTIMVDRAGRRLTCHV